ncbi:MAG: polysaccharide deacetylase family protein [Acetatifactor sp.]
MRKVRAAILAADLILGGLLLLCSLGRRQMVQTWADVGTEEGKKVAITFDDGPHPVCTAKLLQGLSERGVKATFFVTGERAEQNPKIIQRMQEEGHLIGNHTYSHLQLTAGNREQFKRELVKTNEVIQKITGSTVEYVRPPYGCWDKTLEKELSMLPVLWTVDPKDWCCQDAGKVAKRILQKVQDGDIILLHDSFDTSVEAALTVIDTLSEEGFHFVTVEEILLD